METKQKTFRLNRPALALVTAGMVAILASCNSSTSGSSSGGGSDQPEEPSKPLRTVNLSAFSDFDCTPNWTVRDGAWGLAAYSGQGSCKAEFKGESGRYKLTLQVQTEFDGRPAYQVYIQGKLVRSGNYPLSSPLGCSCPLDSWGTVCPDQRVDLNLGVVQINKGDIIKFVGKEDFPCGGEHGAYAKWHGMKFVPAQQ